MRELCPRPWPAVSCIVAILAAACSVACLEISISFPPPKTRLFCRVCEVNLDYECHSFPEERCHIAVFALNQQLSSDQVSCASSSHTAFLDVTSLSGDTDHIEFSAQLSCSHLRSSAVAAAPYAITPLPQAAPPSIMATAAATLSRLPLTDPLLAGIASTIISNMKASFPLFRSPRVQSLDCWAQLPRACSSGISLGDCISANSHGATLWLAFTNSSLNSPLRLDPHHDSIVIQLALSHTHHSGASLNILAASPASALRFNHRTSPPDFFSQRRCSPTLKSRVASDLNLWLSTRLTLTRADIDAGYASTWCARITVVNGTVYSLDPKPHLQATNGAEHWFFSMLSETLAHLYGIVSLPDIDVLVGGEVPEMPHGAKLPILSMTQSVAHMNILYPDTYFLYWDGRRLPDHAWYRPLSFAQ
jgi:hypothetical protein